MSTQKEAVTGERNPAREPDNFMPLQSYDPRRVHGDDTPDDPDNEASWQPDDAT